MKELLRGCWRLGGLMSRADSNSDFDIVQCGWRTVCNPFNLETASRISFADPTVSSRFVLLIHTSSDR